MVDKKAILEMTNVTLPAGGGERKDVRSVNVTLAMGGCIAVNVPAHGGYPSFMDVICGLLEPLEGTVLFDGEPWTKQTPDAAARRRHQIGRTFAQKGWLSNLDMDENITLAERHHTRRSESEIREEALAWARGFGWDELPLVRPAWADAKTLQIGDWVRALTGQRKLLIIEEPGDNMGEEECRALLAAVEEKRAADVAVIWLTHAKQWLNMISPKADAVYTLTNDEWTKG